jgi:hypothetical protein
VASGWYAARQTTLRLELERSHLQEQLKGTLPTVKEIEAELVKGDSYL